MEKILIVDDDIHIGNVLEETLSKEGYKISRAYSGTEALLVLSQMLIIKLIYCLAVRLIM